MTSAPVPLTPSPIDGVADEELLRRSAAAPDAVARAAVFGFDLVALRATRRRLTSLVTWIAAGATFIVVLGTVIPAALIADVRPDYLAGVGGVALQLVPAIVLLIVGQIVARAAARLPLRTATLCAEPVSAALHSAAVLGLAQLVSTPSAAFGSVVGALLTMLVLTVPDVSLADAFAKPNRLQPLMARQVWAMPAFLTLRGGVLAPVALGHAATAASAALLVVMALTAPVLAIPAVVVRILVRTAGGMAAVDGSRRAAIGAAILEPALLVLLAIAAAVIGAS